MRGKCFLCSPLSFLQDNTANLSGPDWICYLLLSCMLEGVILHVVFSLRCFLLWDQVQSHWLESCVILPENIIADCICNERAQHCVLEWPGLDLLCGFVYKGLIETSPLGTALFKMKKYFLK